MSVEHVVRKRLARATTGIRFLPPLLCRVVLGWEFIVSGWLKLHDHAGIVHYFTQLKIPAPAFNAGLVTWTELVCGALLLVGFASRLASIPVIVTMIVALATAKHGDIHGLSDLFFQVEFTYVCMLLIVVVMGPGAVSVDGALAEAVDRSGGGSPSPGRAGSRRTPARAT